MALFKKNTADQVKSKKLTSFVYDGWNFVVIALYHVSKKRMYLQLSTLLGHIPLISNSEGNREQVLELWRKTQHVGRCRMIINDRQMIFLFVQEEINPTVLDNPTEMTVVTSGLVIEARPLLNIYRRFLVSQ